MEVDIQTLLSEIGYKLTPDIKGWRSNALWRSGDNETAILIYNDASGFTDFVTGETGSLAKLVQYTLGLTDIKESENWLKNKNFIPITNKIKEEKLKGEIVFPDEMYVSLIKDHTYWINRGISKEVLEKFKGGLSLSGKLTNRYCFPILNGKNQLIGLTGRDVTGKSKIKWRHIGGAKNWVWPLFINLNIIREKKEIIIVESPGNILSLFQAGIENVVCLFGVELHLKLLNTTLKLNLNRIIIATDNDGGAGNEAAQKIYRKLNRYIDSRNLIIALPQKKDFNEIICSPEKNGDILIREWYNLI